MAGNGDVALENTVDNANFGEIGDGNEAIELNYDGYDADDYDEDRFTESHDMTVAEQIFKSAATQLKEALLKNAADEMAKVHQAMRHMADENSHLKERIEELEKEVKESETQSKNAVQKVMGDLFMGVKPCQDIWYIKTEKDTSTCPKCKGKGKLSVKRDNIKFDAKCPKCKDGKIVTSKKYTPTRDKIDYISVEISADGWEPSYDHIWVDINTFRTTYKRQCHKNKETTGSEMNFYLSLEECQSACEALQKKWDYAHGNK